MRLQPDFTQTHPAAAAVLRLQRHLPACAVQDEGFHCGRMPGIVGPGSRVIHGDYSTDVGVAWDAANTTGLIAFRGSQVWAVGYTLSRL